MRRTANAVAVFEDEVGVEERIARLVSDVAHIRSDMADVEHDIRDLRGKLDATNDAVFEVQSTLEKNIADLRTELKADIASLSRMLERFIDETRVNAEESEARVVWHWP